MVARHSSVLAALLVTAIVGCKTPKNKGSDSPLTVENQVLLAKLDTYLVGCLDRSERIFVIADRYGEGGTVPISPDPKDCALQVERAKTLPPALPEVEAAAATFLRAMTAVHAATTSKKPDELAAAFRDFDAAQGALFDHVWRLNHGVRVDELARQQAREGRTYTVMVEELMVRGEELVRFGATRWDHVGEIDAAAMNAQVLRFESTLDELDEYMRRDPKDKATEPRMDRFPEIAGHSKTFLVAARQLARRAADKVPFSDAEKIMIAAENEGEVVGAPAAVTIAYNNLVTAYVRP